MFVGTCCYIIFEEHPFDDDINCLLLIHQLLSTTQWPHRRGVGAAEYQAWVWSPYHGGEIVGSSRGEQALGFQKQKNGGRGWKMEEPVRESNPDMYFYGL